MWYHLQERAGACALHTSCCEASCTFGGLDLGLFIVTCLVAAIQLVSLKVKKGRAGQKDNGAQRFCGRKVFKSYGTIRRVPNCLVVCFQGCHRFGCGLNKVVSVQAILLAMMFPNEGSAWGPYLILLRHHLGVELSEQSQPA